jgi:hypothetical protein
MQQEMMLQECMKMFLTNLGGKSLFSFDPLMKKLLLVKPMKVENGLGRIHLSHLAYVLSREPTTKDILSQFQTGYVNPCLIGNCKYCGEASNPVGVYFCVTYSAVDNLCGFKNIKGDDQHHQVPGV